MGFRDEAQKYNHIQSVLHLLKKQSPLTLKQDKFCNNACVERFLKDKGDSVKKAAKHLRNCLSWRDSFSIEHLMADEFSHELAEGMAYVAGHDDELRPVMIFRVKQDYQKFHSQKLFTRLLVFTLEVAVQTMAKNVEQFVLLFDASLFRSAPAFMNMLVASLKIIADYYPQRLHKAFVIDPPSLFSYLWKGVRPFIELSSTTVIVSSLDLEESLQFDNLTTYPQGASLRFNPSSISSGTKLGSCSSSRFSFTVSHHFDSLKPWYLSMKDTSGSKLGQTHRPHAFLGPRISPMNARSLSFGSPIARAPHGNIAAVRKGFFPLTPMPQRTQKIDPSMIHHPRTPKASFLQSPSLFFRKNNQSSRVEKNSESFIPFLKFYQRPYDEMVYRSKMRPPLGGLISIVSPQFIRRSHVSISQRY
ncbi:Sec14p-like phosphatidylinositol transfer family protein [Perilla frutescens var. hirtella]|uniref:Sec14p-like phosphatidylinositol transfer family protein n=1 Tax=Perilla frutescens var. hirtella TaxID=608512 RepID=A0AAD4JQA7_PERFH|nr:Sec14p-like phosphatidylinositol transfer family protein [Perilla frutescens var. hirtella]